MHSLHTCRTELLETQRQIAPLLQELLSLNPVALGLRLALRTAQIQYAAALAAQNPPLATAAWLRILQIQKQQSLLDQRQRLLIFAGNKVMQTGSLRVISQLQRQNTENRKKLPKFMSYSIQAFTPPLKTLAVHPDAPDEAPLYELNRNFQRDQSLSVSWKSRIALTLTKDPTWPSVKNTKSDICTASLKAFKDRFQETLVEDKP